MKQAPGRDGNGNTGAGRVARRTVLLAAGGTLLESCGGGITIGEGGTAGDGTVPAAGAQQKLLALHVYPSAPDQANFILRNGAGWGVSLWVGANGRLEQARYEGRGHMIRVVFDADRRVQRCMEEPTGDFLVAGWAGGTRTDHDLLGASRGATRQAGRKWTMPRVRHRSSPACAVLRSSRARKACS